MKVETVRTVGAWLVAVATAVGLSACSSGYADHGITWKPPQGVKVQTDTAAGAPTATVAFSRGVTLQTWGGSDQPDYPRDPAKTRLDEMKARLVPADVTVISARDGSIRAGRVLRFVWSKDGNRTLLYYLPAGTFAAVLRLEAPEGRFGTEEDHFDRSLDTLRIAAP